MTDRPARHRSPLVPTFVGMIAFGGVALAGPDS